MEWRGRLDRIVCLACRVENVKRLGYFDRMRVRAAEKKEE
jgi:hypothetical protein